MKPILFIDFDGTLCHDKFWRSIDAENYERLQNFLFKNNKHLVNEWMRGLHSSEDINRLLSEHLNTPFDSLWNIFVEDCKTMHVDSAVLKTIDQLKNKFHTVLITDNMDCFGRFTVPELELRSFFDAIINSAENKTFKEDNGGQVFKEICNHYNTDIKNCILMDNSRSACDTFAMLGGTANLITREKQLSHWLALCT